MRYGRELPGYPFNAKAFLTRCLIVAQRKIYGSGLFPWSDLGRPKPDWDRERTQSEIAGIIRAGRPAMVARFGSGELEATLRGLAILDRKEQGFLRSFAKLLAGRTAPFWWDNSIRAGLCWTAGYFPEKNDDLLRFAQRVFSDCSCVDILASWLEGETRMQKRFFPNVKYCGLNDFSLPFRSASPWYKALAGKRVLVVHPFARTIVSQYERRTALFPPDRSLPDFDLKTFIPFVTFGGHQGSCPCRTWLEALDRMIDDIGRIEFDVAIVGAGAYGMSLASAVKKMGRIGIHMGGATQVLFGIKGKRWDSTDVGERFYNDAWVRPSVKEVPDNSTNIECGGYW